MNSITYNIPIDMTAAYKGRQIIVRCHDPGTVVEHLTEEYLESIEYVQLLSVDVASDTLASLANWGRGVPLDLVIHEPTMEFPLLYNFSKLIDKHPIRASIAVKPGFAKAVKLALALNFAVKLNLEQPDPQLIEELAEVLDMYLHRPNVSQPVDYFHSIFLSFYRKEPASLWIVQEEDPDYFCFVTDEGVETMSSRFAGVDPKSGIDQLANESSEVHSRDEIECDTCEFMDRCRGYFKWPDKSFSCQGVKSIFGAIRGAAGELRDDLATFAATQRGAQS